MKLALVLALFCTSVFATPAPYSKEQWADHKTFTATKTAFDALVDTDVASGSIIEKVLKVYIDETIASVSGASITIGSLPANSIIDNSDFVQWETQASASGNTLSVTCTSVSDSITLMSASSFLYTSTIPSATGASISRQMVSANGCDVKAVVGTGATGITNQLWNGWIRYNVK